MAAAGGGDLEERTDVIDVSGAGTESGIDTVPGKIGAVPSQPQPPSGGNAALTQPGSHRATLTPEQALRADEVARTRLFLKVCAVLAAACALATPFLSSSLLLRFATFGACALAVLVVLVFQRTLREDTGYTKGRWLLVSYVLMAATSIGVFCIGVFSPAPMVGTLGIYFLCLGSSLRVAVTAYATGAALHFVPAVAIAFGLMDDPGLFTGGRATRQDMLVAIFLVEIVYFLTFLLARGSRKATYDAVDRLHQALAQVQKREALLAEAHLDLDRALKGGFAGRYTERTLGPYQLGEVIGRGAMSEVYRASHAAGAAAVKVLQRDLVADPAQVKRFLREAEIVSGLKSPHVVRVLSFGNFGGNGHLEEPPYIAMELLEGHDLAWHLRRERRMPPTRVLDLIDQVAHALTEAEAAGVVHRDLKPQNLFCALTGWKVLDFGVSKLSTTSGTLTRNNIVGTPGYMAPEQARGEEVGPSADVFSLAVIAYRALTGRPAFAGKDMPQVLFDVCYVQPTQPSRLLLLPEDVERVLALGLAKNPAERIASARALSDALVAAFADRLDEALRRRADALLRREPWGSRPQR
jgi:eukaryotic-like serine/threonine-protein kinase